MKDELTNKKTETEGRTMLVNKGGQKVAKGTYWNPTDGHRVDVLSTGTLPGDENTTYLKIPAGGMLVMAPLAGLLYVVTLPVLGLAAVIGMMAAPIVGALSGTALAGIKACSSVASHASFGYTPMTAHLAGKKRKGKAEKKEQK